LPKPKESQFKINPSDLKIEVCRATGPGGQNVNKRMTAVRIVHLPSGLAVDSHTERNLQQNKQNAMAILSARLLEKKNDMEQTQMAGARKQQIGGAKRAEKIRTYNFPQDRVTDHRIKKTFHNIEGIMEGKLDPITESLSEEN
jgi:peptide chain release factor 1